MSVLVNIVGLFGDTEEVYTILDGKFQHHHLLSDTMYGIVRELKKIVPTTPKNTSIELFSRENYRKGWKK